MRNLSKRFAIANTEENQELIAYLDHGGPLPDFAEYFVFTVSRGGQISNRSFHPPFGLTWHDPRCADNTTTILGIVEIKESDPV